MLYEMVDQHNILAPGSTKDYANLDAHAKRFEVRLIKLVLKCISIEVYIIIMRSNF